MTAVVAAVDLGRTIVQSAPALALGGDEVDLVCVQHLAGAPLSFLTAAAAGMLAELHGLATLVPTTTRTREQYARVRLPGISPGYAVVANGGHLLVDGVSDPDWHAGVRSALAAGATLGSVEAHLDRVATGGWVLKRRVADDLFCYLVVEREAVPPGFLAGLGTWCAAHGWAVSVQGRKVYLIPDGLSKAAAVREVAGRTGATRVLAAGDSLLDAGMLDAAHAGVRPPHGELEATAWSRPHVARTPRPGVLAGEDIARWLLAETCGDGQGAAGWAGVSPAGPSVRT